MGTPVITSDIRGCRDQLGDAGLLANPSKPSDLATKIWKIYNNQKLANNLSKKGRARLSKWNYNKFAKRVERVIKEFENENKNETKNDRA